MDTCTSQYAHHVSMPPPITANSVLCQQAIHPCEAHSIWCLPWLQWLPMTPLLLILWAKSLPPALEHNLKVHLLMKDRNPLLQLSTPLPQSTGFDLRGLKTYLEGLAQESILAWSLDSLCIPKCSHPWETLQWLISSLILASDVTIPPLWLPVNLTWLQL
jgi:hypothetical protein